MKRGYIILLRKFFDSDLWNERREFSRAEAWLDLLEMARWQEDEKQFEIKGRLVTVGRGQIATSFEHLARKWGWGKQRVRTFIRALRLRHAINTESVTVSTRITINNYCEYQKLKHDSNTESVTVSTQLPTTKVNKEYINTEKIKKLSASSDAVSGNGTEFYLTKRKRKLTGKRLETFKEFWKAFAYPKGKAEAADAWMDIPSLTDSLVKTIVKKATEEAEARQETVANGKTPKWAQGWLTGKRWEDEDIQKALSWEERMEAQNAASRTEAVH